MKESKTQKKADKRVFVLVCIILFFILVILFFLPLIPVRESYMNIDTQKYYNIWEYIGKKENVNDIKAVATRGLICLDKERNVIL